MSWNKAPKEAEACKDFAERALKRIAELEAEHRDCLQTITDMQSKWEEVQAENELLREGLASLSNRFDKGLEYDAEKNYYILVWTQRELDVAKHDAEKLCKELGWDKFDAEGEK